VIVCNNLSRAKKVHFPNEDSGLRLLENETGRYKNILTNKRYACFHLVTCTENEEYVLTNCILYDNIRKNIFVNILNIDHGILLLDFYEQFCQVMPTTNLGKNIAKACN